MNNLQLDITTRNGRKQFLGYIGPAGWSEVTPRQAVGIFRFRTMINDQLETLFPALKLLYGMRPKHQRWLFDANLLRQQGMVEPEDELFDEKGEYIQTDRQLTLQLGIKLIDTVRWTAETEPGSEFIVKSFRLLDFRYGSPLVLLKRLWYRKRYFAPADALGNCTFAEFMFADKAALEGDWAMLAAILYRPHKKKPGDFDRSVVQFRADLFQNTEPALLRLIASQFQASKEYLQRCFPYVFPPVDPYQTPSSDKKTNPGYWLDVAINMVKLDATKVGEIEKLNLYLALKVLNEQIRQAEEMEEQIQKMRTK